MTKLYFIVNPKAGNGKSMTIWSTIKNTLDIQNNAYEVFFTESRGHAKHLAKQIIKCSIEKFVTIIVVGGDGTINEVVNGMGQKTKQARLGFIPGGSSNDFSRGYGIPRDPKEALLFLMNLQSQKSPLFDLGKIVLNDKREHFFINSTGVGFDAKISYEANQSKWKGILNRVSLGQLIYVVMLLKNLFSYKCSTIELMIDGSKHIFPDTWFVTVSNQLYYGGGMKIAPKAIPDDGKLDVTVVHQLSKYKLLFLFLSVFFGKHTSFKEVKTFLAQSVSIQSKDPLYAHSDGEYIGITPLQINVQHESISILTRSGATKRR